VSPVTVDLPSSPLGDVDPRFEELALDVAASTFGLPGTSVREKLLQNLTMDVCRSHFGLAFRMHITAAKMHGLTYADLLAALRFIAPYSGYPAVAEALARLKEIATEIGMDTSDLGAEPTAGAVGDGVARVEATDEWTAEFLDRQLALAWSEDRLSMRERAIMALTSDVGQQALGESFCGHIEFALRVGLSADGVRDVVRFCAEHGVARALAALGELDKVMST